MKTYREPENESEEAFFNDPAELLRKLEQRSGLPVESLELRKIDIYLPRLSLTRALKLYTELFNIYLVSRGIPVGYLHQRKNEVSPGVFPSPAEEAESRAVDARESPSCFCGVAQIRLQEEEKR